MLDRYTIQHLAIDSTIRTIACYTVQAAQITAMQYTIQYQMSHGILTLTTLHATQQKLQQ